MQNNNDSLSFYATHGMKSDPGDYSSFPDDLTGDISKLCQIVQNNLIHVFWAERYGIRLTEPQFTPLNLRNMTDKISLIQAADQP